MATMGFPPQYHNSRCSISVSFDSGKTWEQIDSTKIAKIIDDTKNPLWDELRVIVAEDEKRKS
jgi:hypothetical protein